MILRTSFRDVMQEQRDIQQAAVLRQNLVDQLVGEWRIVAGAALDFGKDADASQQVLVHRVVVIHVELHHGDDLAEGRDETAKDAGFVHPPQHGFRVIFRSEDLKEQLVGFLIITQLGVDEIEGARNDAHRIRMEREIMFLRQMKDADQIDGIALEYAGLRETNAILVDDEIIAFQERAPRPLTESRHQAAEHRHALGVAVFQFRAEDGSQIADILCDQEVVLHEALDILQAGMFGIAKPHGDLALDIERQAFLGAAHEKMHVAANRPKEVLAAAEQLILVLVEYATLDQLVRLADAVNVLRDPEQCMEIAQSALAILHVRFDQVTRLPAAADAVFTLRQLGGDEIGGRVAHDFIIETRHQLIEKRPIADQKP